VINDRQLQAQLDHTLAGTEGLPLMRLGVHTHGKVRESYAAAGVRTLIVTDRISAFDVVLGTIPWKGQVLNQLAAHWFRLAETAGLPTHFIDTPDPNVTRAIECRPLPVEFVMRGYLTGVTSTSIWSHYEKGARVYAGHTLPDGLRKNDPLPRPLLTPSTKAEHGGHDETVSKDELLRRGAIDAATFEEAAALCELMFELGQAEAARRGLILVDTKYELGRAPDGRLVFIDEVHTPDSSRYWLTTPQRPAAPEPPKPEGKPSESAKPEGKPSEPPKPEGKSSESAKPAEPAKPEGKPPEPAAEEPKSLDKEYVRRWLAEAGYHGEGPPPALPDEVRVEAARRYISAFELVTGAPFEPDRTPPGQRIARGFLGWPPPADKLNKDKQ
jgi:phosphoribosylaminoimidazole-succinocarboxamide synthase